MAYIGNFDANTVEPADFSALPAGNYTALISSSEFRPTKSGDGQYLVLAFQIVDGVHKNRVLWHNLNLINNNPQAVEIAQKELSAIARAAGVRVFDNSEALHNRPMRITVAYVPAGNDRKGVYREESNRIKQWASLTMEPAAAAVSTPAAPRTPRAPAASRPATPPARPAAPPAPAAPAAVQNRPWGPPAAPAPVAEVATADGDDIPF